MAKSIERGLGVFCDHSIQAGCLCASFLGRGLRCIKTRHPAHDGDRRNHVRAPHCFPPLCSSVHRRTLLGETLLDAQTRLRFPPLFKQSCCARTQGHIAKSSFDRDLPILEQPTPTSKLIGCLAALSHRPRWS